MSDSIAIAVHGGAGGELPEERDARRAGVARAASLGWEVLANGGSALDAVVAAVVALEDDPFFNAGRGAVLTEEGAVELDASLMSGDGLRAGAVAAVQGVLHPIAAARAVLDEGREVLLVGPPVVALARRRGLAVVHPSDLVTAEARRRWRAALEARGPTGEAPLGEARGETVGAVARDRSGHLAAATSTGGVSGKRLGRVGDSAIIGAGTYADDLVGAASATGPGEAIIRLGLVRVALDRVAQGDAPEVAARAALAALERRTGARAGLILLDRRGAVGVARTTPAMPAAWRASGDPSPSLA